MHVGRGGKPVRDRRRIGGVRPGQEGADPGAAGAGPAEAADVARLLQRVARGDQDAFGLLYDQVAGPVFGVVRRVVRDREQTEEVAQEALLDVWRTASRFDPSRGTPMAWVLTVAHRRAVDRVRSTGRSAERERRFPSPSHGDEVADVVAERLEQQRVRRCLEALTDLQRESVVLAYYGGYTYPEVAALLRLPPGTVKTRIRDGLIRLRDCLGVGQ